MEALNNISEKYAVGFGGFGEKRAVPSALPNDDKRTYLQTSLNLNVYVVLTMMYVTVANELL